MTKKIRLSILASALIFGASAFAAELDTATNPAYLNLQLGYSFSLPAQMDVSSSPAIGGGFWDPSPQGYDSRVGSTAIYGLGFGYYVNPLISLELNYTDRPNYSYSKFQSQTSSTSAKTRDFDLESQDVMLNSVYHLAAIATGLKPFINVGIGAARNTVSNFHSVSATTPGYVFSMMNNNTVTSFAAQAGVGLDFDATSRLAFKVGYQFFYGGEFKSNDYVVDDPDNLHPIPPNPAPGGTVVPSWTGIILANEVYAGLTYLL